MEEEKSVNNNNDNNDMILATTALDITASSSLELIDIRTDSIGYTYDIAGDAVRAIHSNLRKVVGGMQNLYNGKHTAAGTTLDTNTGEVIIKSDTGIVSDWIPVSPSTKYSNTVSADQTVGWSTAYYYDVNKKFISHEIKSFQATITTPSKAKYLRFAGNTFRVDNHDIQINEGTKLLPFDGYLPFIRPEYVVDALADVSPTAHPTYYLSENGDDANNGLSDQYPKKTLLSVNGLSNCSILLKSGETFKLTSTAMPHFAIGENCVVSTYGGTEKAIINGYIDLTLEWTTHATNIYKASLANKGFYTGVKQNYDLSNVGHLLVNGVYNWKRVQTLAQLAKEGEYYIDEANIRIYYYTTSKITSLVFKSARNSHAIFFNLSNSSISNIEITGFGRHGIQISGTNNIKIVNNYIHHIGGCKISSTGVRYGNGIELWDSGQNIVVERNHITDCFDAGMTNQTNSAKTQTNISFKKNIVERCWYMIEVFDGSSTARATYKNIVYEDNILMDTMDVTKGYRYNAGQISCASFKVYCVTGNQLILRNNICYLSECYLINSVDTTGLGGITFDGNIYIQNKGGKLYYPSSIAIKKNEQLYLVSPTPTTTDEYARGAYALSLISQKPLSF